MYRLLVLLGLAAMVYCENDHSETCKPLQRLRLKRQWNEVFSNAESRIAFGIDVFRNIKAHAPELYEGLDASHRADNLYSPEFKAFMMGSLGNLDIALSLLDDDEALHSHVHYIAKNQNKKNTSENLLQVYHNALLEVVPTRLSGTFDYDAWHDCLSFLNSDINKARAFEKKKAEENA